jgi:hypothetical protein
MGMNMVNVGLRIGPAKPKPKVRIGVVRRSAMPAGTVVPLFGDSFNWWLEGAPVMGSTVTFDYGLNGGPLGI